MSAAPPIRLSVLDLSPVPSGSTSAQALRNTLDLARLCDDLGYHRYWLAEHHNTSLIASSAPEVMIGHVASVTRRLRVGSGGIMLPNHAPLKVAEIFRMLEALHPGRIDLGLGRAPGTDFLTAMALRRTRGPVTADDFAEQLSELQGYLSDDTTRDSPFRGITAIPDGVPAPEVWLLGSSDFSARLAGERGLPFAFAHHIDPAPAVGAIQLYRESFRPSAALEAPEAMLGVSVICAETDAVADELAGPARVTMLGFQQGRRPGPLPTVAEASAHVYSDVEQHLLRLNADRLIVGAPASVHTQISRLVRATGVDEVMVTSFIHDHADRRRSYELLAEAFRLLPPPHPNACG